MSTNDMSHPAENDATTVECPACATSSLTIPHKRKCPAWDEDGGL